MLCCLQRFRAEKGNRCRLSPPSSGVSQACCAGTTLCLTLATSTGQPVARAEARELLASAIANTQGSYLVYNFGSGHPAPMLNASGSWYDGSSGGHLMIIKAASQRLAPHLLVDSHRGFQARCERDPRARTGDGLMQASETYAPVQAWQVLGQPTIAITPTSSTSAVRRAGRGAPLAAVHRWALMSTTLTARAGPTKRSPHHPLRR